MKLRLWILAPICALPLAAVVYWEYGHAGKEAVSHVTVTITDIQRPSHDPATVERVKEMSRKLEAMMQAWPAASVPAESPPVHTISVAPVAEPRAITSTQFLTELGQRATITDDERKSLTRILKIAADMQPGIDAEPSDKTRAVYQRQLIDAITLRLKLILKDDQRLAIAREGLQDLPRIAPDI